MSVHWPLLQGSSARVPKDTGDRDDLSGTAKETKNTRTKRLPDEGWVQGQSKMAQTEGPMPSHGADKLSL